VTHLDEDTSGFGFDSTLQETTINLEAHNERDSGRTTFNYNFDDFIRTGSHAETISGISHSVALADSEVFGVRRNIELRNSVGYTIRDFTESPGDVVTADSVLSIEHRTNLWTLYEAHYLHDNLGDTLSENYDGGAGIQHKLFASLTSGLRLRATRYTTERPGSDFESTQYSRYLERIVHQTAIRDRPIDHWRVIGILSH
jgi:hypothetical protein